MLTQINELTCPDCGEEISSESRRSQHTNGYWNESRSFRCDAKLEFSPNFMRTQLTTPCPKSPTQVAIKERQRAACHQLQEFISGLDVDTAFRQRILDQLRYL